MALPTVIFNSSTGSDTAASGAGPNTALSGSDASTDGTGLIVTLPNQDLTDVLTDGSHVVWLDTASGRQFAKITNKANSGTASANVTVANAFTTGLSGQTYGLGGKRATIDNTDSRKLFTTDILPGWTARIEDNQSINGVITIGVAGDITSGDIIIEGVDTNRPIFTQTASGSTNYIFSILSKKNITIRHIHFKQSGATKAASIYIEGASVTPIRIHNCIFGDVNGGNNPSSGLLIGDNNPYVEVFDCEIKYCTSFGINAGRGGLEIINTSIHHCGSHAVEMGDASSNCRLLAKGNLIYANSGDGFYIPSDGANIFIENNTIHGNTGDGIEIGNRSWACTIIGNQITGNGGYGINCTSNIGLSHIYNNNFGSGGTSNTSGAVFNLTLDSSNLTVDPLYLDKLNGNFEIGMVTKGRGYPDNSRTIGANQSLTNSFVDIGAAQRKDPINIGFKIGGSL